MNKSTPYLLLRAARLLKASLKNENIAPNMRSVPFHLLALLNDKPSSVLEVAEKLSCSKQEASRLIKAAEANSLISISASETDKRVKNISLSKEGRNFLKGGAGLYEKTDEDIKKILGVEDYSRFKKSLEIICGSFE